MLTRWDPFTEMSRFQDELFRRGGEAERRRFRPAVDVYEDQEGILLQADLPGVKSDNVHVDVNDGVLTLRADRKLEQEEKKENYQIVERPYGTFERSFSLPTTVDAEKINAQLKEGVLNVWLPKSERSKPRRIEVKGD